MAYNLQGFQSGRGTSSAYSQGNGVTVVQHTYKSTTDTLAVISAPGYFPNNFNVAVDEVFINDSLFIVDIAGNASLVIIDSVSPVLLSADLFIAGGGGLTVTAPIVAVDNNGIVISGANVSMEIADATHSGIVTNVAQTFGGSKTFLDILKANNINGETPADMMFIGAAQNPGATITIGNPTVNLFLPGGLITDNISNVTAGSALAVHANFDGITIVGQDTASATTGIRTNKIDTISPGGHPLVIGSSTIYPIEIGSATSPILAKGGVRWDIGGGTISAYAQSIVGFVWQGAIAATAGSMTLNKFEDIVECTLSNVFPAVPAIANLPIRAIAPIPAAFRPTADVLGVLQAVDNSSFVLGSFRVEAATGDIYVFASVSQGLFTLAGNAGLGNITASWSTVFP